MDSNQPVPAVSIGLPVYNGEPFLEGAIESILKQTCEDFELIISDNASTDRTEAICRDYAAGDHRIRYVRNDRNLGLAKNSNRVFCLARAQYFKWAAADDLLAPGFIEQCRGVLDANENAVLAYPQAFAIDENGRVFDDYSTIVIDEAWPQSPAARFRRLKRELEWNDGASVILYASGLMRRGALSATGLYGGHLMAERNLVTALSLQGRFCRLDEHLLYLRAHSGSTSWFEGTVWSQDRWQDLLDPSVKSYGRRAISRRRHYVEDARALLRSSLGPREKCSLLAECACQALTVQKRRFAGVARRFRLAIH